MPRLSLGAMARRRIANQASFFAQKRAQATTPSDRARVAWDQWRALLRELPADQVAPWADALARTLDTHIARLTQILDSDEGDRHDRR
ncbi:hypothetical protein [Actinoallomurus sp. CA-142502]|uniref:hypothetical protein n=1 Tax=Actinoallomurus sp. CA-142502 TaxID=3239885 RepID=UPI003D933F9C